MPIVIGARYNPYSFDDMLKPLAMAQQEYNTVQEGLSSLTDSSNQFSQYLEGTEAGKRVAEYNQAIDSAITDMAKNGLRATNRDTLLGLKRQYNNDIAKINQAAAQIDTMNKGIQQARIKASASGDTLFVANMPNVDTMLADPTAAPTMISGSGLQKQGMQAAQSASIRRVLNDTKAGQGVMHMYNDIISRHGYNSAEAQKFLQDVSTIPELANAMNTISSMYGVDSLGSEAPRAKQFIMQGIMDGLTYSEKHDWKEDPEKKAEAEIAAAYNKAYATGLAKYGKQGGASGMNGAGSGILNGRLNSPAANKQRDEFKKYFTDDGKLTQEGWEMYKSGQKEGVSKANEAAQLSGTGWAPGMDGTRTEDYSFRDFVNNNMKVTGSNGYIKPSDINNAWKAYNSVSSPSYGDTDSYGTIDVPVRETAGKELKKQLAFAYNSTGEVDTVVDIDKEGRSWKMKGTVDMEELMSDDYSISRIQASPYTKSLIVNFVSKKDKDNVNIELPLRVIAGDNSAAMLQTAYSELEKLEKMPAGSAVPVAGMGYMTREQAMDLQYKAIQRAMMNTMTYYDQEATKEPK